MAMASEGDSGISICCRVGSVSLGQSADYGRVWRCVVHNCTLARAVFNFRTFLSPWDIHQVWTAIIRRLQLVHEHAYARVRYSRPPIPIVAIVHVAHLPSPNAFELPFSPVARLLLCQEFSPLVFW